VVGLKLRFIGFLLSAAAVSATDGETAPFLFTQAAAYTPIASVRFPAGASLQLVRDGVQTAFAPSFAASADAAVSFDGRHVLFSGKQKPDDAWQIWEVSLAGGAPRRITQFREDAVTPFYITPERIVFARRTPTGFQLEVMPLAGSQTERLTYAPGDHLVTGVLRDGRILFDAPDPELPSAREIFTVYADGTGVESYRCDHRHDRHDAVELASGDIVFETGGKLARFTSARALQVDLPAVNGALAGRIAELSPDDWLVAFRVDAHQPFAIHRWRPGAALPEKISGAGALHAVQPVLLRPHEIPKRHPSALGNREGVNLLCLNAYTSRSTIPPGSVASVKLWLLDEARAPRLLGQAPVETDGSFFVNAPSERPLRFELLDAAGKTIVAEKSWFWARRGEQRVCVGCHAGPERAPDNAVPATILRSTEPAHLLLPQTPRGGGK
jgi:Hydrazine synthase alpha subunit middle domain